jgi:V-type H+-transporting ATPase subunit D
VSNKKQRDQAAQDAELKAARAKQKEMGGSDKENEVQAPDVLGEKEDEDVIF